MKRLFALLFALALPVFALAQSWPVHETVYVNDYAKVIEEGAEGRITTALKSLRDETGIEATVLTLHTRWGYENPGSLEQFATGLFNHWGIGRAETNDGILILVVTEDREMRVELGSGYDRGYDREAQDIIDRIFLPAFREGDYSRGIEDGTGAVISRIALEHHAGNAPPAPSGGGGGLVGALFGALFAVIAGVAIFGRRISDRFSRCPECGQRGIHRKKNVLESATRAASGRGERITDCPHCGYHGVTVYTIPRITRSSSSSGGGSFGGGSSSGGGASGRW